MIRSFALVSVLLGLCAADSGTHELVGGGKTAAEQLSGVSPDVDKSDKKFFGKDYPWDKRPKVDVLHFKHPYPVVQDSDDYDKDFVKDENKDDGSWAAQSEYDRLRHKLRNEKADVSKALSKKTSAEKALREAIKRKDVAQEKARVATEKKRKEAAEAAAEAAAGKGEPKTATEHLKRMGKDIWEAPSKLPESLASPGDVRIATDDTQRAMDALEECKKALAEARNNLKGLMKELEGAQEKQRETESSLTSASSRQKDLKASLEGADKVVKSDYQQYIDAREAYLKQQALVAKMEADIKAAAAKVKSFRDGEDANGGVYNTPPKNGAPASVSLLSGGLLVGLAHLLTC